MDSFCENFVRRIIGHGLELSAAGETTLKDSIENQKQREQLQKTDCNAVSEDTE